MNVKIQLHISSLLKVRNPDSHKGDYGHAIIIAGDKGKMGAAIFAAKACLRAGVGLLTVNTPEDERSILQISIPEAMLVMRENMIDHFSYSSGCIGPGIGTNDQAKELVISFIDKFNNPLLIDADALNIIAHNHIIHKIKAGSIITPHEVEFDRLFGVHSSQEERRKTAIEMANKHSITIVLKGHHTFVTANGQVFINDTGNAGLAKGGSGDALSGIICALLAQGYESFNAAKIGVYIHGLAADIAMDNQSMESLLITDVIERLGDAFKQLHG